MYDRELKLAVYNDLKHGISRHTSSQQREWLDTMKSLLQGKSAVIDAVNHSTQPRPDETARDARCIGHGPLPGVREPTGRATAPT
jgi:hypothetical protein